MVVPANNTMATARAEQLKKQASDMLAASAMGGYGPRPPAGAGRAGPFMGQAAPITDVLKRILKDMEAGEWSYGPEPREEKDGYSAPGFTGVYYDLAPATRAADSLI